MRIRDVARLLRRRKLTQVIPRFMEPRQLCGSHQLQTVALKKCSERVNRHVA